MTFSAKSTKAEMWAQPRLVAMHASHGAELGSFPHRRTTPAYMSTFPATDKNKLSDLLNGTKGSPQYIEVSRASDVYLLSDGKSECRDNKHEVRNSGHVQ